MKRILFLFFTLISFSLKAQAPDEQKAPWIDSDQTAFNIQLDNNADNVEGALVARLKKDGLKVSSKKKFITCLAANWSKIGTNTIDVYFKIKKVDNAHTMLYMFVSKGYNNFINSQANPDESSHAKDFLVSMINETKRFELNLAMIDTNKKIKDANGDLDDLVNKQRKMEDQIKDLNRKLEENHTNQNDKSKQIDELKSKLGDLQNQMDGLH